MTHYCFFTVFVVVLLLFASAGISCELESFGGWEGDTHAQGYGFVSLGGSRSLTHRTALVGRVVASYLYYDFDKSASTIEVTSPGVAFLLGTRFSINEASAFLFGGAELRWNREGARVENNVSGDATREEELGVVMQGLIYAPVFPRTWMMFLANYGQANQYTFCRLSFKRRLTNTDFASSRTLFVGLEGTGQGNDDIISGQVGAFIEIFYVPGNISVTSRAGFKQSWFPNDSKKRGAYIGLDFYTHF